MNGETKPGHVYHDACACTNCEGSTRIEYGFRYDAPAEYAGLVTLDGRVRSLAESRARAATRSPHGEFKCTVVQRTVSVSDWSVCDG